MNTLTENSSISRVNAALAAGQGTTDTSGVNLVGYHGVTFLANLVTVGAGGTATLSVQGRNDSGEDWTALEGSVTRTEAGVIALEVSKPTFAEMRARLVRAEANVTTDAVMAIRTKAANVPTDDPGQSVAVLVSPEAE